MCTRVLELIFFLYFASHIFFTLFVDLQALLPGHLFPQPFKDLLQWYIAHAKDQMMADPPVWFKSLIFCEALLQLPFFPVAAYAFLKGGCRWIRTPAIIYSTHVASVMVPILTNIMFHQFPKGPHPGPQTTEERLGLLALYGPYLLVPLMILFTMLFSPAYNSSTQGAKVTLSGKKHR